MIEEAMIFAKDTFGNQTRKGPLKLPAFWHACDVVTLLASAGITNNHTISLAYLHDVLEDTSADLYCTEEGQDRIAFGGQQIRISPQMRVDLSQLTNPQHMEQADRKAIELMMAGRLSAYAARVRIADKISNMRSLEFDRPKDWTDTRVKEYKVWAYEVISACEDTADCPALMDLAK